MPDQEAAYLNWRELTNVVVEAIDANIQKHGRTPSPGEMASLIIKSNWKPLPADVEEAKLIMDGIHHDAHELYAKGSLDDPWSWIGTLQTKEMAEAVGKALADTMFWKVQPV